MFSLNTDVFVPTEGNQQKIFRKIWYIVGTLIATADKSRIRVQRHMRICNQSTDPKIRIRIKMARLRSTAPYSVLRGKSVTHTKIIIFGFQKQIRIRETNPRQMTRKSYQYTVKKTGRKLNRCLEFLSHRQYFSSVLYKIYARHPGLFFKSHR